MLKSCSYCGRIHDSRQECPARKKAMAVYEKNTLAAKTRNKSRWQKTRAYIRNRDHQVCQLCLRNYPGTLRPYETGGLGVHHIVKLEEDASKAYDEDNLITLCRVHHEMADRGEVSQAELIRIAIECSNKYRES